MTTRTVTSRITPKDFFLTIGSMVALYVSAVSLLGVIFQFANTLFPDALDGWVDPYSSALRGFLACLIVFFPIYLFLTRRNNQDVRQHPEKSDLWIRKWLIYLTLFVAGVTIAIDLVTLVNTFLGGELTTRFIVKTIAVLIVTGGLFAYYLADLRGVWERNEKQAKMKGVIASLVIVAIVIGGLIQIGSPAKARAMRFDEQRIQDLQSIQWDIVNYWQTQQKLPVNLEALTTDTLRDFTLPSDPETKAAYVYRVIKPTTFELCAPFATDSSETPHSRFSEYSVSSSIAAPGTTGLENSNWNHGIGETCFDRTIDPKAYPPFASAQAKN
jgi:hypothetical protein